MKMLNLFTPFPCPLFPGIVLGDWVVRHHLRRILSEIAVFSLSSFQSLCLFLLGFALGLQDRHPLCSYTISSRIGRRFIAACISVEWRWWNTLWINPLYPRSKHMRYGHSFKPFPYCSFRWSYLCWAWSSYLFWTSKLILTLTGLIGLCFCVHLISSTVRLYFNFEKLCGSE